MSCCGGGLSYSRGGKNYSDIIEDKFKQADNIIFLIGKDGVSLNESKSCSDFLFHYDLIWEGYPDAGFSYYKKKFLIPSKKLKPTKLHYKVAEIYSKLTSKKIIIISTDEYGLMKKCFDSKNIDIGNNLLQVGGTINDFRCFNCRKTCVKPNDVKCQRCKGLLKPAFPPFSYFKVSEDTEYMLRHLTQNDLIVVVGMGYFVQQKLLCFAEKRTWRVGFKTTKSDVYQSSRLHPSYRLKNDQEIIDKLDYMMNNALGLIKK